MNGWMDDNLRIKSKNKNKIHSLSSEPANAWFSEHACFISIK